MELETFDLVCLGVMLLTFALRMLVWRLVMGKPVRCVMTDVEAVAEDALPPVSVVVCVKHKFQRIDEFLSALLSQNYPNFEIIIVGDGDSDNNEIVISRMLREHDNLYITQLPNDTRNISRKKLGLTLGIKAAHHDCLVFTEADSMPVSNNWLRCIAGRFDSNHSVALGLSALERRHSPFGAFRAYDYFYANLQFLAFALLGKPYAGNGRNMAYRRDLFNLHKGFSRYRILPQGEDDLYINEVANRSNTAVALSAESIIKTRMRRYEWKNWRADRTITSRYYRRGPVAFWRTAAWTGGIFAISAAVCIADGYPFLTPENYILPGIAITCSLVLIATKAFIINSTAAKLGIKTFGPAAVVYDWIRSLIDLKYYFYRIFKKTNKLYDNI